MTLDPFQKKNRWKTNRALTADTQEASRSPGDSPGTGRRPAPARLSFVIALLRSTEIQGWRRLSFQYQRQLSHPLLFFCFSLWQGRHHALVASFLIQIFSSPPYKKITVFLSQENYSPLAWVTRERGDNKSLCTLHLSFMSSQAIPPLSNAPLPSGLLILKCWCFSVTLPFISSDLYLSIKYLWIIC